MVENHFVRSAHQCFETGEESVFSGVRQTTDNRQQTTE
jgi:hypothetical protein